MDDPTTHFGYQRVAAGEKAGKVDSVFESVAPSYDLMNDLMSLGVHRLWKRFVAGVSGVREGQSVLDVAGGTGDLARLFVERVGARGKVVLLDFNSAMLAHGRRRLLDAGILGRVDYVQADAQCLPFPDASFDCVSIGFGLRNVTDLGAALRDMHRVLRPGGRLLILEFSRVVAAPLRPLYDAYSFSVLPWLGRVVAGDADSYRYLAESIRMHPGQDELEAMMRAAGFERCSYRNLTAGVAAMHSGYKL